MVGLRHQQFANQWKMARIAHGHRKHGKIARDPVLPQTRLPHVIARQPVPLRAHPRIGIQQVTGELLKPVRRGRHITSQQVLLKLLDVRSPDPAAVLLSALGVDRAGVRAHLLERLVGS